MSDALPTLPPHRLEVALFQPQIAPNTGNIGRLCVATGCPLHLVRPLGFTLDQRNLRRSGMDYWPRLQLTVHDDNASFFTATRHRTLWFFTTSASQSLWTVRFHPDDMLAFGSETSGLSPEILAANAARAVRIPQAPAERCLNLSTATGIALYEALRQTAVEGS